MAMVRISARDTLGNILPFCNDPLMLSAEGNLEIVGPKLISLSGGMGGTFVKSTGREGAGKLIIESADGNKKEIEFMNLVRQN